MEEKLSSEQFFMDIADDLLFISQRISNKAKDYNVNFDWEVMVLKSLTVNLNEGMNN